jgi:hypothetical protein
MLARLTQMLAKLALAAWGPVGADGGFNPLYQMGHG